MRFESNGFRVTEICPQIDKIEVDGEGLIRVTFRAAGSVVPQRSDYMSVDEFAEFIDAGKEVLARIERERDGERDATPSRPLKIRDGVGDAWEWRDDHDGYVIGPVDEHDRCKPDSNCGQSLEWIKKYYGPIEVIE